MTKIALVTGASRGIGAATAVLLAEQGYDICINYINNVDAANQVLKRVKAFGVKAIIVQADVSQEEQVVQLFDEIDKRLGKITALVNNAGILMKQCKLTELTAERINKILRNKNIFRFPETL